MQSLNLFVRAVPTMLLAVMLTSAFSSPSLSQTGTNQTTSEKTKYFCGRGVLISIDEDKSGVTIKHQEIEGYMAAMTMHFKIEGDNVLEGVKPGDQVRFVLKDTPARTRLVSIDKIVPRKSRSGHTHRR